MNNYSDEYLAKSFKLTASKYYSSMVAESSNSRVESTDLDDMRSVVTIDKDVPFLIRLPLMILAVTLIVWIHVGMIGLNLLAKIAKLK